MKERGNKYLRFFDRYIGIPLIIIFSLFHKKRKLPKHITKIAFLKSAGIGDIVLLSALIADFQKKYGDASMTLFTGNENFSMEKLLKGIDVIPLPVTSPLKALKILRQYNFDLFIDADPWPRINALLTLFSRSKMTFGFKTKGQWRHFGYDVALTHSSDIHELENYRKFLKPLYIDPCHLPKFDIVEKKIKKRVVLHLFPGGSRATLKTWDYWKELYEYLDQNGYEIYFTGSSKDRILLEKSFPKGNIAAGKHSLLETAHLLASSEIVITVDTGIMHLAAAIGCFVISLHGPTSPKRWGALGDKVVALTPPFTYTPCISLGFEKKCLKNHCMKAITPDMVITTFTHLTQKDLSNVSH